MKNKENKLAYVGLIARVYEIDPEAAWYLHKHAPKLPPSADFHYSSTLVDAFTWLKTPQGEDYWLNISEALGE